jgi:hypothetical protein
MVTKKTRSSMAAKEAAPSEVDEFLARLEHPRKAEIEAVRAILLGADARIQESIKWNAPSFSITEHFATFNLRRKDAVQVVLHRGAKVRARAPKISIRDPSGMLQWVAKDRCTFVLMDMKEIESRKSALRSIVKQWIRQMS